jgi:hypothetical protein
MIRKREVFAWTGAHSSDGKTIGWICGLWYLIKLPAIVERFPCIFFLNYDLSLLWITMSIILTLVNSMGMVLSFFRIEQQLDVTH